ncbi:hypothetical protein C8R34_12824 [Nitrosomonas sp. Nm84]|uniref:hypothetical protein n=1 Tax=Nitrosomonas sp. Nm84 TaxID=200124 RepID=UPI000D8BBE19|nr:hypothetical protein [Nitrosomonas sp. Nm84]PXW83462.1 hypothetical protein C8R34_12824 [Nitrosomonas sp. Nm84]
MLLRIMFAILGMIVGVTHIQAAEWSGFAAIDLRAYVKAPAFPEQNNLLFVPSGMIQPEFRHEWNGGIDRLTVIPFARVDAIDENRTHFDIREFNWLRQTQNWSLRAGVGRVFWGVTESRHLVDIVNQIDFVENINGEEKLGQPMLNLNIPSTYGNFNFILMPYFRDRTFSSPGGRLRFVPPVDQNASEFSDASRWHPDWAVRWSRTFGNVDIGIAHFMGIGREPRLLPRFDNGPNVAPTALIPIYDLIQQTSLDAQASLGNWLFKLESITRSGQGKRFAAVVAGVEYTHYGLLNSDIDLGLLAEYLYDGRDRMAPPTPFNNDVYFGVRLAFNDTQNSQILAGVTTDVETQAKIGTITASRRIGEKWKIELESRFFSHIASDRPATEILTGYRQDDYIQFRIARYF